MGIQLVIEFLDLFKGSLEQNSERASARGKCIESYGYIFGFLP